MAYFNSNDLAYVKSFEIDEKANEFCRNNSKDIKTNQIRNIYSNIKLIKTHYKNKQSYDDDIERELILLKPMIAYAKGRQPKQLQKFQELLFEIIDKVIKSEEKEKALENFFAIIESIVAYHKFYGGKDN